MLILGIDPGYAIVGFGIVEYNGYKFTPISFGAITTPAGKPFSQRLNEIYDGMNEIFSKFKIDAVSVEKLYFNTNTTTAIDVAEARGVILLSAERNGVPIYEYTPLQVKQSISGYGRAEKSQIIEMTRSLLGLAKPPKPDDAADALALAVCHGHVSGSLLGRLKEKGKV